MLGRVGWPGQLCSVLWPKLAQHFLFACPLHAKTLHVQVGCPIVLLPTVAHCSQACCVFTMAVFYVVCIVAYRVASVWRSYHVAPVWLISPHSMMVAHLIPQKALLPSVVANPVIVVYGEIVLATWVYTAACSGVRNL